MQAANPFEAKYKQLNLLGKGNYGKVYKVKLNDGSQGKNAKYFVAKRMALEGLSQQQIQSAFGQIAILQKINSEISKCQIPFVVSYQQFFRIDNELIIIMEYCQCGDLSTLLKNMKKNSERLSQKIIAYWLIQILFGMKALHSKNILHRDLKSANIFLTQNYCLKIGDFGISKVLEQSSAITCIGTPLYLSPQVCNNQPYSYSSDMWALGCILYEMCSLRYPFQASNMIVLAKKIVMDEVADIPAHYSSELNSIVKKMLVKDSKKRLTAHQFLTQDYIKENMKNFIKDQGRLQQLATPISLNPSASTQAEEKSEVTSQEQQTMKTIKSVVERTGKGAAQPSGTLQYSKSLTPKQKMMLRKEQQTRRRMQELNQAAKDNIGMRQMAKHQKAKNLSHTSKAPSSRNQLYKKQIEMTMAHDNRVVSQIKKARQMQKIQTINLAELADQLQKIQDMESDEQFEEVPLPSTSQHIALPINKTIKQSPTYVPTQTMRSQIKEQINEYDEELDQYFDQQFEKYQEDYNITIKKNENILAYFESAIDDKTMSPSKRQKVNAAFRPVVIGDAKSRISSKVQECHKMVGQKRYDQLVRLFKQGKIQFNKNFKKAYTPQQQNVIFRIQEIIFEEGQ